MTPKVINLPSRDDFQMRHHWPSILKINKLGKMSQTSWNKRFWTFRPNISGFYKKWPKAFSLMGLRDRHVCTNPRLSQRCGNCEYLGFPVEMMAVELNSSSYRSAPDTGKAACWASSTRRMENRAWKQKWQHERLTGLKPGSAPHACSSFPADADAAAELPSTTQEQIWGGWRAFFSLQ